MTWRLIGVGVVEVPLEDVVAAVRDELLSAVARGAGQDLVFEVGPVEMEFVVELRADVKAKAGFKLWAVGAEAEAGGSRGRSHRVSFTLTPKNAQGGDLLISGENDRPFGPGPVGDRIPD